MSKHVPTTRLKEEGYMFISLFLSGKLPHSPRRVSLIGKHVYFSAEHCLNLSAKSKK